MKTREREEVYMPVVPRITTINATREVEGLCVCIFELTRSVSYCSPRRWVGRWPCHKYCPGKIVVLKKYLNIF